MTTRPLLLAAWLSVIGMAPGMAHELTVATRADLAAAQQDAFFTPFSRAADTPIHVETWVGGVAALRAEAERWDLALVDGATLLAACTEGVLAKLDWPAIGGRDRYQAAGQTDCGAGAAVRLTVLAWDHDKFPGAATWADFWDVAKFPGKRGLQRSARMNLEIALIADGVAVGDVYRVLRTDDGADRAFRKLEQIKPYLVWWRSPVQAVGLIASGGVLLSTAPGERIGAAVAATGRHFGTQTAGSLFDVEYWATPKSSGDPAAATRLLASLGDPARQAHFASATGLGVLVRGATDGMAAEQLAVAPSNQTVLASALEVDEAFWHDNADRLDERFDAWLAH